MLKFDEKRMNQMSEITPLVLEAAKNAAKAVKAV